MSIRVQFEMQDEKIKNHAVLRRASEEPILVHDDFLLMAYHLAHEAKRQVLIVDFKPWIGIS